MVKLVAVCSALVLLVSFLSLGTKAHIRMRWPAQRSSLWRHPKYKDFREQNEADDAIYCGGIPQLEMDSVNCGVCGDPLSDPTPRPNESGGKYGKTDIIAGKFMIGQSFKFNVEVVIAHGGSFEIRLCDTIPETEECFKKYPALPITTGPDNKTASTVPIEGEGPFWINGTAKLPADVHCNHCVLRLNYRAGGGAAEKCPDGTKNCGPQLLFRNCVDIRINPPVKSKS